MFREKVQSGYILSLVKRMLNEFPGLVDPGAFPLPRRASRMVGKSETILPHRVIVPQNVWSAARLQGKSEWRIERSAQMYLAFDWR
jgi:hypothetical protein